MTGGKLAPEVRQMAELLHAEIVGRLFACERLENENERIDDPRVLYGWNLLTQEVLIRLAEATLKLLHLLHFNRPSKRAHSLVDLWSQLPQEVQNTVEARRNDFPGGERGVSFKEFDMEDFQNVRYSYERLSGGQTISFESRRLYLDALAASSVAEDLLGEIRVWPWAGMVSPALAGYKIIPVEHGKFEILIEDPIDPMDWAGAIIEAKDGKYFWTLYCGYTDAVGGRRSFEIQALFYSWPTRDLFADTVEDCAEKVHEAYSNPCIPLLKAIQEAKRSKQPID